MKDIREPFDEELSRRLRNYLEEPGPEMWEKISSDLAQSKDSGWLDWPHHVSGVIMLSLVMYLYQVQSSPALDQQVVVQDMATPNEVEVIDARGLIIPGGYETAGVSQTATAAGPNHEPILQNPASNGEEVYAEAIQSELDLPLITSNYQESMFMSFMPSDTLSDTDTVKRNNLPRDTVALKNNREIDRRKGRGGRAFTAYFAVMPLLGYQRIESNTSDNTIIENIKEASAFSTERFGFRLELGVETPISKKFNLFGSLSYLHRNLSIEYTEMVLDSTSLHSLPDGQVLIEPHFSYPNKTLNYELRNLGLQLGLQYRLSAEKPRALNAADALTSETMLPKRRFVHFVGSGVEFHKSLNQRAAGIDADFEAPSTYVFFNVYYRLQYPHEGQWRTFIQPTFNYSFYSNERNDSPLYLKPYGFGLNFGCTYSF